MSAGSSLLVEQLWRLKRLVDKGFCPGLEYVHLNNLLRNPEYREDVLRRVEIAGNVELKMLAAEIRASDTREPLMAPPRADVKTTKPAGAEPSSGRIRRNTVAVLAALAVTVAAVSGFITLGHATVRISTDITSDTTWKSGKTYRLERTIYVHDANLTIEDGVTIQGDSGAALVVTQHGKLFARGRPDNPIVFTSGKPEGKRQRGDWGGVVLLGKAPVNQPDARIEGLVEGDNRGLFGGRDPDDSCGVVEYVRIEFAGFEVYKNNELNGLTLGGCGSNTIVRNVQVHRSLDDGIELFGGTVDLKNIVITGAGDDSIDWDWGWTGQVQFAIVQQHPDVGDNAFEGDNNGANHDAVPRSAPAFYNVTLVGTGQTAQKHRAILLREGSAGHFHNMIVDSYGLEVLDLRDSVSRMVDQGELRFANNLLSGNAKIASEELGGKDDDAGFDETGWIRPNNLTTQRTALGPTARNVSNPDFRAPIQAQQTAIAPIPESEFLDESADYQGALNPTSPENWLDGWTAFPEF